MKRGFQMPYDIIDFHTHPFLRSENNICSHQCVCNLQSGDILEEMRALGVSKFCGSVIAKPHEADKNVWDRLKRANDDALKLREIFGDAYIPGFHVHPAFVEESIEEIHRMNEAGVRLIGELVPYSSEWESYGFTYASDAFSRILDEAEKYDMVVSIHSQDEDAMDEMVKAHPHIRFVAAHPGEYAAFMRHIERAKMSDNYYLDLSGTGVFRYGMLRRALNEMGTEHILFGSDYPTCNPAMFLGAVLMDPLITDEEREKVLSGNAKALLGL
jgi:predicted TIM-barrel fold metal-dependent hydrolase